MTKPGMEQRPTTGHGEDRARVSDVAARPLHRQPGERAIVAALAHEHADVLAVGEQAAHQVGAQVAGGAGDEDHGATGSE